MKYHELIFDLALYLSYILYIFVYFQIGIDNREYLDWLQNLMKYYVTIFLIIRFNPFTNTQFTEFDRKIVFSSAIFLLATTTFSQYADSIGLTEVTKIIHIYR